MKIASLSAIVAAGLLAGGLTVTSANAADLGGNCCADLEERIAELEATTARKGNRKVSLTISGWVAEQVTWFDDGEESNTFVSGIGTTLASHVKFTGQATISPGWTAGYVLHIEAGTVEPLAIDADTDDTGNGINVLQSYWFVKSDHLGKVGVGRQSQATDNLAILVDGSGSLVPANWVLFDGANFNVRGFEGIPDISNLRWGQFANCESINAGIAADCNGLILDVVRYDSPTFAGFSFSTSWGEDDMWDVAARYAGEFSGFKIAAAIGYTHTTDEFANSPGNNNANEDTDYVQAGLYIQHVPTGLFAYGAYGVEDIGGVRGDQRDDANIDNEPDHWYVKAGIRQRWTPLGHTVLYGEYARHNDQISPDGPADDDDSQSFIDSSELERYGLGIVQEVDAAAMSFWLAWRHHELEVVDQDFGKLDADDVDIVKFGALINF